MFGECLLQCMVGRGILLSRMKDEKNKPFGKEISQYVGKLLGEIKRLNENDRHRYQIHIDEKKYLTNAELYLKDLYQCDISIFSMDDSTLYDPANKKRYAVPLRPAIYIE